jgi:hypothetical protein
MTRSLAPWALAMIALTAAPAGGARAQAAPARDLLRFPLGTMDRAPALGSAVGDGLGNPAAILLDSTERLRVGVAALQTPAEQGVSGRLVAAVGEIGEWLTVGLSVASLGVDDLVRTETDPQAVSDDFRYRTTVYSLAIARRNTRHIAAGVAARFRTGELDRRSEGELGVDAGVIGRHLPFRDATIGAATFLWRPGSADDEDALVNLAADLRVLGSDPRRELRAGYSISDAAAREREHFVFGASRYGPWEARAGAVRADAYGGQHWRTRLGIAVHYAPYAVGLAREENGAGLGAMYQFTLRATFR